MTDVTKQINRIPHESLGENETVSTWQLPRVGQRNKVVKSAKREQTEKQKKTSEQIEDVPRSSKPKPMTANELQKIADQAQQEGYADGFKEGMEKGLKQGETKGFQSGEQRAYSETKGCLDDEKRRFEAISNQLFEPMQHQDKAIENRLVTMVMVLSKALLAQEITQDPSKLLVIVERVLAALPVGATNIRVYVNEGDAKLLEAVVPAAHRDWQLMNDNSLASGGCRVETLESLVDYSLETRLAEYLQEVDTLNNTTSASAASKVSDNLSVPEVR